VGPCSPYQRPDQLVRCHILTPLVLCLPPPKRQDHYDFGMRALKSVLVMAGALKRGSPDSPEDAVLIRAMRDANLPKLLPDDAALFEAIIGDLFPGVAVEQQQDASLQAAVEECCSAAGLQPEPAFVTKASASVTPHFLGVHGSDCAACSGRHRQACELATS
jgi:hypothetical protein